MTNGPVTNSYPARPGLRRILHVALGAPLLAFLPLAPGDAAAGSCTVEDLGQRAYARIIGVIPNKFPQAEQFTFAPIEEVQMSVPSSCVLHLHGDFSFKRARNQEHKAYDADLTPKSGQPQGMKIMKLQFSGS
jgi:hypothetical protein